MVQVEGGVLGPGLNHGNTSVQADGFTIDGSNAAKILLNDAYWTYGNDNDASDAFFRSVAVKSFDEVLSNIGSAQITDG